MKIITLPFVPSHQAQHHFLAEGLIISKSLATESGAGHHFGEDILNPQSLKFQSGAGQGRGLEPAPE
jgi:hypothetical protein